MDAALAERERGPRLTWNQQQVLNADISPYVGHRSVTGYLAEPALRQHRRQIREVLDASAGIRGTLANRLSIVRLDVKRMRRAATLVECLCGKQTTNVRWSREFAESLERAADRMKARVRDRLRLVQARLERLPFERAEALRPVRTLRLKPSAFGGNRAEPECPYITDGTLLVAKAAIKRQDRTERLAQKLPKLLQNADRLTESICADAFQRAVETATDDAQLLGYFDYQRQDSYRVTHVISIRAAVVVTAADEAVFLDAALVRFIDSVVGGFDALKVRIHAAGPAAQNPGRRAAYDPAVFYQHGKAVGILMPLRYNLDDIPLDIPTARLQAGRTRERTAKQKSLVEIWLGLGSVVPWMHMAERFDRESFIFCRDLDDLIKRLLESNYHDLGAAFALGEICFINLNSRPGNVEEWLAIKGSTAIGNIPLRVTDDLGDLDQEGSAHKIQDVVELLQTATEEQCTADDFIGLL